MRRRHFLTSACLITSCVRRGSVDEGEMLPDFGALPEFALTAHTSARFTRSSLQGRIWILDLIFTNCTQVCPRMAAEMRKLQERTRLIPQAMLLSISVDPERDTPQVLAEYAARNKANSARWLFLTGEKQTIRAIQEATQRHLDPDEITAHSKQLYLVDGSGYVRGVYSVVQPTAIEDLMQDLHKLIRKPAKPEPET